MWNLLVMPETSSVKEKKNLKSFSVSTIYAYSTITVTLNPTTSISRKDHILLSYNPSDSEVKVFAHLS